MYTLSSSPRLLLPLPFYNLLTKYRTTERVGYLFNAQQTDRRTHSFPPQTLSLRQAKQCKGKIKQESESEPKNRM